MSMPWHQRSGEMKKSGSDKVTEPFGSNIQWPLHYVPAEWLHIPLGLSWEPASPCCLLMLAVEVIWLASCLLHWLTPWVLCNIRMWWHYVPNHHNHHLHYITQHSSRFNHLLCRLPVSMGNDLLQHVNCVKCYVIRTPYFSETMNSIWWVPNYKNWQC